MRHLAKEQRKKGIILLIRSELIIATHIRFRNTNGGFNADIDLHPEGGNKAWIEE